MARIMTTTLNPWQVLAIEQALRSLKARGDVHQASAEQLLIVLAGAKKIMVVS